jgi:hypothetical protein
MIRIRHVTLPPGLSAFVRRNVTGDLEVFVSDTLDSARAKAAVRLALRSFQSEGSRTGLLPLPVGLLLAGGIARIRSVARAIRAHAVLTAAVGAATAVTAALVILVAIPHQHGPATAGQAQTPGGQAHVSAPAHSPGPTKSGQARSAPSRHGTKPGAGQPAVPTSARSTSPAGPQPSTSTTEPAPQSSSPAPQPSGSRSSAPASSAPSPSPSPTGGGGGVCVVVLGVWVCL